MVTIAYDKPVLDLIAGLDATGHVTHTQHRKDKVTIHHNGGRLTHQGVLSVWQSRPASAHFNVDAGGTVAQYVRTNEYAWATGNTAGNQRSISIEMCNETVGPEWRVSDTTWKSAARLAGWLFARVIGTRPSRDNLVQHKDWSATACAGPHVAKVWSYFIDTAQQAYDAFVGGGSAPTPKPPSGGGGKSVSQLADEVIAGQWGNGDDRRVRLQNAGYDYNAVQAEVNRKLGGGGSAPAPGKSVQQLAEEVLRGEWGNDPQRRALLLGAGHDASAVQAEVNRRLSGGAPAAAPRAGIRDVASSVIRGEWGNGADRVHRLTAAGYNAAEVQAEVNRQLGY